MVLVKFCCNFRVTFINPFIINYTMSQKITPEQQRAVQVLLFNLPNWKEYYQPELSSSMFPTNFMAFSTEPFHKLPHDDTWIWNQSNAKVTTELDQYHECTLQKMNTRKRKNCPKAPSFKIWLFALNKKNQPSHLYFLWCEKGLTTKTPVKFPDTSCLRNNNPANFYSDVKPQMMPHENSFLGFDNDQQYCNNNQQFGNNNQFCNNQQYFSNQPNSYAQPIHLDDLSFLKPFIEQDVAMELGWY